MKTQTEDKQLLSELEELYLQSKHWISDLEFLERNLDFIEKLYAKAFSQLVREKETLIIIEIISNVSSIKNDLIVLKSTVIRYLHTVGLLIKDQDQVFDMSLIKTHADLEIKLDKIFEDFRFVKNIVMDFAKNALKDETITKALLKKEIEHSAEFRSLPVPFLSIDETELTEEELEHFCYNTDDTRD